jgi:hypothetical protein
MQRDARGTPALQVVARDRLQRGLRRLVVGALDAQREALAGAQQPRGGDDRDAKPCARMPPWYQRWR